MEMLAALDGSLHVGLAALGSAIGVGLVGMKAAEATGRNPGAAGDIRTQAIIFAALPLSFALFHRRIRIERAKGPDALYRKMLATKR